MCNRKKIIVICGILIIVILSVCSFIIFHKKKEVSLKLENITEVIIYGSEDNSSHTITDSKKVNKFVDFFREDEYDSEKTNGNDGFITTVGFCKENGEIINITVVRDNVIGVIVKNGNKEDDLGLLKYSKTADEFRNLLLDYGL